jgi:hypothetical protein
LTSWREWQQPRVQPDALLTRWFRTPCVHLGILTGRPSQVIVIDVDDAEARQWARAHLPDTPMRQRTPRGGEHWFYRHPGGVVPNRVRVRPATAPHPLALDVRGDGGYVRYYGEAATWPESLDDVPVFQHAWLAPHPLPTQPRAAVGAAVPLVARARAYLAAIPPPEIGCGSDAATFVAACRLVRGFGLAPGDAEDLLWDWCGNRDGWTREWVTAKVRNADRHGREPRGGLR